MSRAERRAYERMTKNQDRYALPVSPASKRRAEKVAQQRAARPARPAGEFSSRYLLVVLLGAGIAGLLALSVAWPSGMPFALYVGSAAAATWVALTVGLRLLQRRVAARR